MKPPPEKPEQLHNDVLIKRNDLEATHCNTVHIFSKNLEDSTRNSLNIVSDPKIDLKERNSRSTSNNKGIEIEGMNQHLDSSETSNIFINDSNMIYIKSEFECNDENVNHKTAHDKTNSKYVSNKNSNDNTIYIKTEISGTDNYDDNKALEDNIIKIKKEFIKTDDTDNINDKCISYYDDSKALDVNTTIIKKEFIKTEDFVNINDKTTSDYDNSKATENTITKLKKEFIEPNDTDSENDKIISDNEDSKDSEDNTDKIKKEVMKTDNTDNSLYDIDMTEIYISDNTSKDESNVECQKKVKFKRKEPNAIVTAKMKKKKKTKEYKCSICDHKSKTSLAQKIHEMYHRVKRFKCSQCLKKFSSNNALVDHKLTHKSDSYKCQSCDSVFKSHCDYLVHQIVTHTEGLEYTCPECDITYNKRYIRGHLRHHFYNKVECPVCSQMINKKHINLHIDLHNSEFKCAECGHISKSKKMYDYHMAKHTGVYIYQCYYCGEGFRHGSVRNRHMDVYHKCGKKLFQCYVCKRMFKKKNLLQRHMATHDSKKEVICDYCGKKYTSKMSLRFHILQHVDKQK